MGEVPKLSLQEVILSLASDFTGRNILGPKAEALPNVFDLVDQVSLDKAFEMLFELDADAKVLAFLNGFLKVLSDLVWKH